jgi:hypothetical protein
MFAFGDAHFYGSTGGAPIPAPVIGMARTPSGNGYWLAGRDGAIYAFGDARTYGAADGIALTRPIMTVASSPAS